MRWSGRFSFRRSKLLFEVRCSHTTSTSSNALVSSLSSSSSRCSARRYTVRSSNSLSEEETSASTSKLDTNEEVTVAQTETGLEIDGGGGGGEGGGGGVVVPVRRASRLTGSQLANALGWWPGGREQVWEEKLGLREPFRGNDATRWGQKHEPRARDDYEQLTGHKVLDAGKDGLALLDGAGGLVRLHRDENKTWLGAAPDGVIPENGALLEIKCPYNRGYPREMKPWATAPWYYMAQVQSLMEIFDMEHCHFYCWTIENGSRLYFIERDREYWNYVYCALEEFWHKNLVPAREVLLASNGLDVEAAEACRPREIHMLTEYTKVLSQRMVKHADSKLLPPNVIT